MCKYLNGDSKEAERLFAKARSSGKESTEADKYAARALSEPTLPSVPLTKARYFTDGGYYEQALQVLSSIDERKIRGEELIEYHYRKARMFHKMGDLKQAIPLYESTIAVTGNDEHYFAPNACLQLGYIYKEQGNREKATYYFEKALSYRKHEYKNSIDTKARSALNQLKERR
jgi:tetratricopeptide (TPR) repeat protein